MPTVGSEETRRPDPALAADATGPGRSGVPPVGSEETRRPDLALAADATGPGRSGVPPVGSEESRGLCAQGCPDLADPRDIGRLVRHVSELSEHERSIALLKRWVPNCNDIPSCKHVVAGVLRRRACNKKHVEEFDWLVFSQFGEYTGAWCVSCLLFRVTNECGGRGGGSDKAGKLVTRPLRCFKNLTGKKGDLIIHANTEYHKDNQARAREFLTRVGTQHRVDAQLATAKRTEMDQTAAALHSIVDTIRLAATQNIAFRGHRDDGRIDPSGAIPDDNDGNFRMLLRYRLQGGDQELAKHLRSAPSNALYTSKTSQNQLLLIYGDMVKESVIQRVKESPFWCVSADETTDRSSREQMTITLRYVTEDPKIGHVIREDPVAVPDVFEELGKDGEPSGEKRMTEEQTSAKSF